MRANRGRSASYGRRCVGVAAASLLLLMALAPTAGAGLKQSLDQAKARLAELKRQIGAQQAVLDRLSAEAAAIAMQLDEANRRFQAVLSRLNERVREAYMQGPGSPVEFLLGATSLADLSDRLEFVDALAQSDSDLADQVQNLKNQLSAQARNQQRLQARQADILGALQDERAKLQAQFFQQKQIYDDIQANRAEAEKLVERLGSAYRDFLASLSGVSNGVLKVCPVDQPRAVYDGFGAPRYAGGYHPHAGNDIVAP